MGEHKREAVDSTEESESEPEEVISEVIDVDKKENVAEATPEEHEQLKEEVASLKKEKDNTYERMLRVQAEFENYKRRSQKERTAERKYKSQELVEELLPAIDNFERALQTEETEDAASILKGVEMVYKQIKDAFKSQNIEEIETVGEQFDPNLHHAVMQVEDEEMESSIILEELQKGYMLNERVIRAAMVKVNK